MSETPNTTTESKVEEIRDELRATALEAFNASPSTGFQAGFDAAVDAVVPSLAAALSEEGQGEAEHRLSREDGERLEEIAYWCEKHGMDPSAASYLTQLSKGILSGPAQNLADYLRERASFVEAGVTPDEALALYKERQRLKTSTEPPQDDVGRLREKLLSPEGYAAVLDNWPAAHLPHKVKLDEFDGLDDPKLKAACAEAEGLNQDAVDEILRAILDLLETAPAPDVERLGGEGYHRVLRCIDCGAWGKPGSGTHCEHRNRAQLLVAIPLDEQVAVLKAIDQALESPESHSERDDLLSAAAELRRLGGEEGLREALDRIAKLTVTAGDTVEAAIEASQIAQAALDANPSRASGETEPAARRERAVEELLALARIADDKGMRGDLERLASHFSYPPCASSGKSSPEQPKNPPASSGSPSNSSATRSVDSRAPSSSPQPHTDSGRDAR